ncbi:hypothetical protein ACWGCI_10800 [Streptomyces sp. NPDC054949]|uniref:hypothetical protein n=1 Tax=unclassified Streptomyces TaxID=2593676 RepID=UPI0022557208|nr:hypothetical protein [Streptomyces sp. NBC_00424]MCX5079156.1 hypothetical protein [Streptomyces sp. NBC_00424]WUD39281.1 hypothetical protein OHA84_01515 [Streptomyces sp. NBC_00513]
MPKSADLRTKATLYGAAHFQGAAVAVTPDKGDEGETMVVHSLAHLGLSRVGSLTAPGELADPDHLFSQHAGRITHVTVWSSRPATWHLDPEERGRTWQQYDADTGDLGSWADRSRYVRVWSQKDGAEINTDPLAPGDPSLLITVVE